MSIRSYVRRQILPMILAGLATGGLGFFVIVMLFTTVNKLAEG